jgi:hypothetical protein
VNPEESPIPGLDALPRERLPTQDLWAGIAARIEPARQAAPRRALWPDALAASVCSAVLVGALLRGTASVHEETAPAVTASVAAAPETDATHAYSNHRQDANRTAAVSARTLRMLRSDSLDNLPAMVAQRADGNGLMKTRLSHGEGQHAHEALLRANLKLVRQAEREVRRALREEPESEALQNLLASAEGQRAQLTALLLHGQD